MQKPPSVGGTENFMLLINDFSHIDWSLRIGNIAFCWFKLVSDLQQRVIPPPRLFVIRIIQLLQAECNTDVHRFLNALR